MANVCNEKHYNARTLADRFGLEMVGDAAACVDGVCAITPGRPNGLAFIDNPKRVDAALTTQADIVVVSRLPSHACESTLLISPQPKLTYARIASLFESDGPVAGVADSAVVDKNAALAASASIGANAVVGCSRIGERVVIGAGAVIGDDVEIGADTVIGANAAILAGTHLGERVRIGASAVIGDRGFGLVPGPGGLEPVPQLGGVRIGHDVEIGANSTIDRGAIDDTIVEAGVKIDNQVHVAHNCRIGAHTVIAGCTGIAGSCVIGRRCMIGGGVGIGDHVTLADEVVITAASQVPKSIDKAGVYSSTLRAMPARNWRRLLALWRVLDRIEARLSRVESRTGIGGDS